MARCIGDIGICEVCRVELPIRLVSEANRRGHWSKHDARREAQRNTAYVTVSLALRKARANTKSGRFRVRITRIAPRRLDSDNLARSCKSTRDGVADALGVDDGSERVLWVVDQRQGRAREYAVEILIETEMRN